MAIQVFYPNMTKSELARECVKVHGRYTRVSDWWGHFVVPSDVHPNAFDYARFFAPNGSYCRTFTKEAVQYIVSSQNAALVQEDRRELTTQEAATLDEIFRNLSSQGLLQVAETIGQNLPESVLRAISDPYGALDMVFVVKQSFLSAFVRRMIKDLYVEK